MGCPLLIIEPVSQAAEGCPGKTIREEAASGEKGSPVERRGHLQNHTPSPHLSLFKPLSFHTLTPTLGSRHSQVLLFLERQASLHSKWAPMTHQRNKSTQVYLVEAVLTPQKLTVTATPVTYRDTGDLY